MDQSIFQLSPKIKEPLHIFFLLDNSFIYDDKAREKLRKDFTILDQFIFKKEYSKHVHIEWIYFENFSIKALTNQSQDSLVSCLDKEGLPKFGGALELALDKIDTILQEVPKIKPWLFMLHQGFKVGSIEWNRLAKYALDKKIFFRGFVLNDTISISAIQEIVYNLPYMRIKQGKISEMFDFIFQLAQQRVGMSEDQNIKLPSKDVFARWGDPIVK